MERKYVIALIVAITVLAVIVVLVVRSDLVDNSNNSVCFADNGTKNYVGLSADECSRIRYFCVPGRELFSDDCGCGCIPANTSGSDPNKGKKTPIHCTEESRNAEACTMQYESVCGWFDTAKVQCITYPCAINAGNNCEACLNPDVLYYTEGMCPTPGSNLSQ